MSYVFLLHFLNHFASFTNYCAIGILLTVKEIMMLPCPKYNFDEKFYTFFVAYSSSAGMSLSGQHWQETSHSYLVVSHRKISIEAGLGIKSTNTNSYQTRFCTFWHFLSFVVPQNCVLAPAPSSSLMMMLSSRHILKNISSQPKI